VVPCDQTCCVIERLHTCDGGLLLYSRNKWADWNQARDGVIGEHTDAGGQCTDAVEAGVRADGLACILLGWLGGRVVSVPDSGSEEHGFKS